MYYEVLGVPRTASETELRSVYRRAVKTAHPDHGGDVDTFRRVQDAWAVLGDPNSRRAYDARSEGATPSPAGSEQSSEPRPAPAGQTSQRSTYVPPANDRGEPVRPAAPAAPAASGSSATAPRGSATTILLGIVATATGGVTLWILGNSGRLVGIGSLIYLAAVIGCLVARATGHLDQVAGTYRRLLQAAWILAGFCLAMAVLRPLTGGPLCAPLVWATVLAAFAGSVTLLGRHLVNT